MIRPCFWRWPSTADNDSDRRLFRITHPFHPLSGHQYEVVSYTHSWGEHRVFFRFPGDERVSSVPAGWTDIEGPDAFVAISGGRSFFRVADLVDLLSLIEEIERGV